MSNLIHVEGLHVDFPLGRPWPWNQRPYAHAVAGVSLEIPEGRVVGLVGGSGQGKSVLLRATLGLVDPKKAIVRGSVLYGDRDLLTLPPREMRPLRRDLALVQQDPYSSHNPRLSAGASVAMPMGNFGIDGVTQQKRVRELMELVGLRPEMTSWFPHQFSGGQLQRLAIARALALNPRFVACDEPLASLDASLQAEILELFARLKAKLGTTMLFVSHDLRAVRHISDVVAVMFLGKIVELGAPDDIVHRPQHPYTKALVSAISDPDPDANREGRIILTGDPPSPKNPPSGCVFRTLCPFATTACAVRAPALRGYEGRLVACDRLEEIARPTASA